MRSTSSVWSGGGQIAWWAQSKSNEAATKPLQNEGSSPWQAASTCRTDPTSRARPSGSGPTVVQPEKVAASMAETRPKEGGMIREARAATPGHPPAVSRGLKNFTSYLTTMLVKRSNTERVGSSPTPQP